MKRRPFIKSVLGALSALLAPAFAPKEADATLYMMPFVSSCGTDDWATRSAGAVFANRLDTQAAIDLYAFQNVGERLPVLDTGIKSGCSAGSTKMNVLNVDNTASGEMRIPFGQDFGNGSTFWISYRIRQPATHIFQPWPVNGDPTAFTGAKQITISWFPNSQTNTAIVESDTKNMGALDGYHYNGAGGITTWETAIADACSGSDLVFEPSIDNYPVTLVGVNPDTGAAWSACEQDAARYGFLYSRYGFSGAAFSRRGLGDWLSGGFRPTPNEWLTVTHRIIIGHLYDGVEHFDSRITVWAARDGKPYVQVYDNSAVSFGDTIFNAAWVSPYCTNRAQGGKQIASRTNNIGGVSLYTCGLYTPIGTGVLEYDASVQRFRWHGAGEPFGAAAGFSAVNRKMLRSVISGAAASPSGVTDSYLILHVDNPASLPPSGVVTDNVVIADGRPDTQVNYADFIVSTSEIKAPGGFAAVLPALPYTIPTQGHFKNISLNNMVDVQACQAGPAGADWPTCVYQGTSGVDADFSIWSGGAYGADYSPYGALFVGPAGAHGGYVGNEVYAFDLTTALWARLRNPSHYTESQEDQTPGSPTIGQFPDGQPAAAHLYGTAQFIPASWYGGVKGKYTIGHFNAARFYSMDMDSAFPRSWVAMHASGSVGLTGQFYGYAARDDNRRGIWTLHGLSCDRLTFVDGATGAVTYYFGSTSVSGAYMALGYSPLLDVLIICTAINDGMTNDYPSMYILSGANPNAGFQQIVYSGNGPLFLGNPSCVRISRGGLEWSTILKKFVCCNPQDDGAKMFFFNPPAGATTFAQLLAGTWTWTTETLVGEGGAVPTVNQGGVNTWNGHYNRFREVPLLKSFVWADGAGQPVQLWRPTGMV